MTRDEVAELIKLEILRQAEMKNGWAPYIVSGRDSLDAIEIDGFLDLLAVADVVLDLVEGLKALKEEGWNLIP